MAPRMAPSRTWQTPRGRDWEEIAAFALGSLDGAAKRLAGRLRERHEGACAAVKVVDGDIEVACLSAPALDENWERLD